MHKEVEWADIMHATTLLVPVDQVRYCNGMGGGKVYFFRMGWGSISSRSCIAAFLLILRLNIRLFTIVAYDFWFVSVVCFSLHRELFWKPCACQIYAKRSSNCELMLKKSSFFHYSLNFSGYSKDYFFQHTFTKGPLFIVRTEELFSSCVCGFCLCQMICLFCSTSRTFSWSQFTEWYLCSVEEKKTLNQPPSVCVRFHYTAYWSLGNLKWQFLFHFVDAVLM